LDIKLDIKVRKVHIGLSINILLLSLMHWALYLTTLDYLN